jgi:hypothetical protein
LDELQQTKAELENELNALQGLSPGVKQVEQLKVKLKQSLNAIDIKLAGRPVSRSTSLRASARKILNDKDELLIATKQPLQSFGETVFELASSAREAFAREFHDQLSRASGGKVIGQLKNPTDPSDKLKLVVQKANAPDFDTWKKTNAGKEAAKEINKGSKFDLLDIGGKKAAALRDAYDKSDEVIDKIAFDQFILDNNIPLSELLSKNKTLTELKRKAIEDTKSVDKIAQNFIEKIPEDLGESEYRRYRATYSQYFSNDLYLAPGPVKKWFAKMHNKIANESILAEYWSESIPDKYGLVIKKVALNLFADPVINFLNDDTESMGESEAIDASLLNSLSNAAHAAGSALGPVLDMSTTNYNF